MTITGYGFDESTTVKVDGVPCTVKSHTKFQVQCETGTKTAVSTVNNETFYIGQHGLRSHLVNSTGASSNVWFSSWQNNNTEWTRTETLLTEFEHYINKGDRYVDVINGWFKAPATA